MPDLLEGLAVGDLHLVAHLGDGLAEEMGQHVRAKAACIAPSFRIACGGDPDGQFLGHRPGLGGHGKGGAILAGKLYRLAAPEAAQGGDRVQHCLVDHNAEFCNVCSV